MNQKYCGYIGLIGRPNVGKSTLLNKLLGQKLSITSRKAQTTRHRILGINNKEDHQLVYVDTPGIHAGNKKAMNRVMNKSASMTIVDVDVVVLIMDSLKHTPEDEYVLEKLANINVPVILVLNKVDKLKDIATVLPLIDSMRHKYNFVDIVPLSAKSGLNVELLETQLCKLIPKGEHLFYSDQLTDRPTKFIISEFIREKIFRLSGDELPYSVTVEIEKIEQGKDLCKISALILVEKDNHKPMIIGNQGSKLKEIGRSARQDIEKMLDKKVFLQLWVKVKHGWSDDIRVLKQLGYDD